MPIDILVATPYTAFGELLRISLEDVGKYRVQHVSSGKEAILSANKRSYQLAILDSTITDIPFEELCRAIQESNTGLKFIVIPPDNNPHHPMLENINPNGFINRPFYQPDLVDIVSRLLEGQNLDPKTYTSSPTFVPSWFQETNQIQTYLQNELPKTRATAGIIAKFVYETNELMLISVAGNLPEPSVIEVINIVSRFLTMEDITDLIRFVRLTENQQDYLIYTSHLIINHVLILLYKTTTSLSVVRPEARAISNILSFHQPDNENKEADQGNNDQIINVNPTKNDRFNGNHINKTSDSQENLTQISGDNSEASEIPSNQILISDKKKVEDSEIEFYKTMPGDDSKIDIYEEKDDEFNFVSRSQSGFSPTEISSTSHIENEEPVNFPDLAELLGSFPPPDPNGDNFKYEEAPTYTHTIPNLLIIKSDGSDNSQDYGKSNNVESNDNQYLSQNSIPETQPSASDATVPSYLYEAEINPLEDTRPHIISSLTKLGQLEPVSPALSQLKYTCILLPRFPQHYLSGKLADDLAQWIPQVCLAFGWRLEAISIRPEFLQWTVQVSPSISPGNVVRIIRQRSSYHIFNQYQQLSDQNPSGDFWAAGYLIISGSQSPSSQLLRDYIDQTRKRQGF